MDTTGGARQQPTCAGALLGTWTLESCTTEHHDTGEKTEPFGAHPRGFLSYGADGRMYAIIVREGRKPPRGVIPTGAEKIELFTGMGSYAGTYSVEADVVNHHVEISWLEAWTGTTQVRHFKLEGELLYIRSPVARDLLDGRPSSATLVWARAS